MDSKTLELEARKQLELFLEKQLSEGNYDRLTTQLKLDLEAAIPGKIDDVIIDALFPSLIPLLKKYLLEKVELISDEV